MQKIVVFHAFYFDIFAVHLSHQMATSLSFKPHPQIPFDVSIKMNVTSLDGLEWVGAANMKVTHGRVTRTYIRKIPLTGFSRKPTLSWND